MLSVHGNVGGDPTRDQLLEVAPDRIYLYDGIGLCGCRTDTSSREVVRAMSIVEGITVGAIVLASAGVVYRQFAKSSGTEKGSCKGCGDSCACVIKEAKTNIPSGSHKK